MNHMDDQVPILIVTVLDRAYGYRSSLDACFFNYLIGRRISSRFVFLFQVSYQMTVV
uniref:Uncharacterized protein n=1 Tax=Nelumbo nucifera TaxID=4432 RepID=A0A822XI85_NELNU|nr:TPA_asm: hypothetical protein HUJ06_021145 [Nelumbo nucifera]